MPQLALPVTLFAALVAPVAVTADTPPRVPAPGERIELAQLTIHERIIIRVPRMPDDASAPLAKARLPRPVTWREHRGPHCIAANSMAGALVSAPNQVDLVLLGGRRVRAKLDGDCRPLDFYSGFYLRPSADGMICADRDSIRVRSGAACGIDQFKALEPRN